MDKCLCGVFVVLMVLCASQASVLRRNKRTFNNKDIDDIITMLGPQEEVDIILLVDRSRGIQIDTFNLRSLRLLERIVRQYTTVSSQYAHIAAITFAVDTELAFDSISDGRVSLNKARLFSGDDPLWNRLVFHHDEARFSETDVNRGFNFSSAIFEGGR